MHISGNTQKSLTVTVNQISVSISPERKGGGIRGKVTGMSDGAKSRLMRYINGCYWDTATFVTLTYRYNMQDDKQAYADLRKWHRDMSNTYGLRSCVWRKELQKRGAIHYHLFLLDAVDWREDEIAEKWLIATRQEGDVAARTYGVCTKTLDVLQQEDAGVIVSYLCKYATKDECNTTGRAWGVIGKSAAPQVETRYNVEEVDIESVAKWLEGAGGKRFAIQGGGYSVRLYLGKMGCGLDGEGLKAIDDGFLSFGIDKIIKRV